MQARPAPLVTAADSAVLRPTAHVLLTTMQMAMLAVGPRLILFLPFHLHLAKVFSVMRFVCIMMVWLETAVVHVFRCGPQIWSHVG